MTQNDGLGPHLGGVYKRRAGSLPGYSYSPAMKRANIVWDDQTLDSFIAYPQRAVPGNHVSFSGRQSSAARSDVVDYLKALR